MDYAVPRTRRPPLDLTLARQPTTVKPLGDTGTGHAGRIAALQARHVSHTDLVRRADD
jgi:hypothetical protein